MAYDDKEKATLARIGGMIRKLRKAIGLSQEELAFRAGLDRTYVGSVERGERNIAVLNLIKIAKVLGVEAGAILGIEKESE